MPLDTPSADLAAFASPIPEAVRRASARADELARAAGAANVPAAQATAPAAPAGTTVVEPETDAAKVHAQTLVAPAFANGTPPSAPAAPTTPVAPAAPASQDDPWEQRYRTLQGKYDSETASLRAQVTGLQNVIATIQTPAPASRSEQVATASPAVTRAEIPKEDVEAYGEDLIVAARRWARTEFQGELDGLRNELKQLKGGQQQLTAKTSQQSVIANLDGMADLAGKWRELNTDSAFLAWLAQADPFSGTPRQRLLTDAYGRGDANRVAAFFRAYLNEQHTTAAPAPGVVSDQTPPGATTVVAPPAAAARPTLESFAAPGRTSGPAPVGAGGDKRLWTHQEISAFYRGKTRGEYAGRDAEANRIEADIIAAAQEGRVR